MDQDRFTPDEVSARGEEIYQKQIRSQVENGNKGKFVVIDIVTGDYELDVDDATASMRLLARNPQAVIYGLRVGHPAAYRFGGSSLPKLVTGHSNPE